jgi:hypothetical protein
MHDRSWIQEKLQENAAERRAWPEWLKATRNLDENGAPRRPSSSTTVQSETDTSSAQASNSSEIR